MKSNSFRSTNITRPQHGLKFLFSANSMKDETGGCKDGYCTTDLHPSKAGNDALYEYSKNHLGSL